MKKFWMFGCIILIILSVNVTAHSPSSLSIKYDTESDELVVSINHIVSDSTTHYIYNITIEKNNELYKSYAYNNQPSSSSFTYTYGDIVGETGDMFSVVARCNQGGQISKSITVGSSTQDNDTPGFEIIVVVCSIAFVLFWQKHKTKNP